MSIHRYFAFALLLLALAACGGGGSATTDTGGSDSGGSGGSGSSCQPPACQRVGFIGNSLTYVNDIPSVLKQIAAGGSSPLTLDVSNQSVPGGWTLGYHAATPESIRIALSAPLDYLFFQEQSAGPGALYSLNHIEPLLAMALARGVQPVLYQTWRTDRISSNCNSQNQPFAYNAIAQALPDVWLAPVGDAFSLYGGGVSGCGDANNDYLSLLNPDDYHQSAKGAYLAALTMYATLFKRSPSGLAAPTSLGITSDDQIRLQQAAWTAYQGGGQCSGQTSNRCQGYQYAQRSNRFTPTTAGDDYPNTIAAAASQTPLALGDGAEHTMSVRRDCQHHDVDIVRIQNSSSGTRKLRGWVVGDADASTSPIKYGYVVFFNPQNNKVIGMNIVQQRDPFFSESVKLDAGETGYLVMTCIAPYGTSGYNAAVESQTLGFQLLPP